MAITYGDVKYYKSDSISFTDDTINGKGVGVQVLTDSLNAIFPEITATERESGLIRRAKLFIKNDTVDRKMSNTLLSIAQPLLVPDIIKIFYATEQERITFELTNDVQGADATVTAGTSIDVQNVLPVSADTSDLVGRKILLGIDEFEVDTAPNATSITLTADVTTNNAAGTVIHCNDIFDAVENDETFLDADAYVNTICRGSITQGISSMDIAIAAKSYFEIGDKFVLLDGYFRIIFRAEITDVQDHATDVTLATLTFDKTYTASYTVLANEGYIANSIEKNISPGETISFWAEMTTNAESAVTDKLIAQWKLSVHFDDITA